MPLADAFNIQTATREVILAVNLNRKPPENRAIRRALGFREVKKGRGVPIFESQHVRDLYQAIDKLSKTLPYDNLVKLSQEWQTGRLLQDAIGRLVDRFGPKIWNESASDNSGPSRPRPHLIRAGEDQYYAKDLFIENPVHREYIKLQLEHLAYAKAAHYHYNHVEQTDRVPGNTPTSTAPKGEERSTMSKPTKRNIDKDMPYKPSGHIYRSQRVDAGREDSDEELLGPEPKRFRLRLNNRPLSYYIPELNPDSPEPFDTGKHPDLTVGEAVPNITPANHSDHEDEEDSPFSDPPDGLSEMGDALYNIEGSQERSLQSGGVHPSHNAPSETNYDDNVHPRDGENIEQENNQANDREDERETTCSDSPSGTSQRDAENDIKLKRLELRTLLLGEFGTGHFSHANYTDVNEQWDKSKELNKLILELWDAEKENNLQSMGLEIFNYRDHTLRIWISWRDNAEVIGRTVGLHPSDGNLPQHTPEEWRRILSTKAFDTTEYYITKCQVLYARLGKLESISEMLSEVFASLSGHLMGPGRYTEAVVRFNKQLFSWNSDFGVIMKWTYWLLIYTSTRMNMECTRKNPVLIKIDRKSNKCTSRHRLKYFSPPPRSVPSKPSAQNLAKRMPQENHKFSQFTQVHSPSPITSWY
ncbi:hypothetical protein CC78DRAFT_590198 [Lojkania enalia]|uniref:Uncharacterized protein n=1 Tax=Lojkania enalia TaxID=147567 RepID=A0A9P4N6U8_9PLEO|nr:hypothetical protein CC78DRAFT_590198 [Didymosphaeria enalia]